MAESRKPEERGGLIAQREPLTITQAPSDAKCHPGDAGGDRSAAGRWVRVTSGVRLRGMPLQERAGFGCGGGHPSSVNRGPSHSHKGALSRAEPGLAWKGWGRSSLVGSEPEMGIEREKGSRVGLRCRQKCREKPISPRKPERRGCGET